MQLKSAYREILRCSSVPSSRVYCTTKIITEIWQSIDLKMKVKHLLLSWFQIPWAPSKYQLTVSANSARLSWLQHLAVNSEGVHGIWKWFEWQFFCTIIFISKLVSNLHKIFFILPGTRNLQWCCKWYLHPKIEQSRAYIKLSSHLHTPTTRFTSRWNSLLQ